ncbi:rhomboid family intramembrane serine protease, partial [Planctomycetota bacterium]|nr:rhomboid family intramembrane serine protease [Planctomycetota bacterium]
IFGTLGVMVTSEWTRRGQARAPWVRRVAPLFGGAVLFGWLGVGDGSGRVDVLAHATGFMAGALIGIAVSRLDLAERLSSRGQAGLAATTLAIIAVAWFAALR